MEVRRLYNQYSDDMLSWVYRHKYRDTRFSYNVEDYGDRVDFSIIEPTALIDASRYWFATIEKEEILYKRGDTSCVRVEPVSSVYYDKPKKLKEYVVRNLCELNYQELINSTEYTPHTNYLESDLIPQMM